MTISQKRRKQKLCINRNNKTKNIVYTEDKVPVVNIVVKKLPANITTKRIKKHFSKFGEIDAVKLIYGKRRSQPKHCVICFKKPDFAASALHQRRHRINRVLFKAESCPSWQQPLFSYIDWESSTLAYVNKNYDTPIRKLNDDVLFNVFKYLTLQSQIRLSLSDSFMRNFFMHYICPNITVLDFEILFTFSEWEFRHYSNTVAPFIEKIEILRKSRNRKIKESKILAYKALGEKCQNLHTISVNQAWKFAIQILNYFNLENLVKLELCDCSLKDNDLKLLPLSLNLKTLNLACNIHLTGVNLPKMPKLERLCFYMANCLNEDNLLNLCKGHSLNFLDVRYARFNLNDLHPYLCDIETFKFTVFKNLNWNLKLPKLTHIVVRKCIGYRSLPVNFFDLIDVDKITTLQLECLPVAPQSMLHIARYENLRILGLIRLTCPRKFQYDLNILTQNMKELELIDLCGTHFFRVESIIRTIQNLFKLKTLDLRHTLIELNEESIMNFLNSLNIRYERMAEHFAEAPQLLLYVTQDDTILNNQLYVNSQNLWQISLNKLEKPIWSCE